MARPSIGEVVTNVESTRVKKQVRELTVLNSDSKESIYHLIFEDEAKGEVKQDE